MVLTSKRLEVLMIKTHLQVTRRFASCGLVAASLLLALGATALAQRPTGVPDSPSATTNQHCRCHEVPVGERLG